MTNAPPELLHHAKALLATFEEWLDSYRNANVIGTVAGLLVILCFWAMVRVQDEPWHRILFAGVVVGGSIVAYLMWHTTVSMHKILSKTNTNDYNDARRAIDAFLLEIRRYIALTVTQFIVGFTISIPIGEQTKWPLTACALTIAISAALSWLHYLHGRKEEFIDGELFYTLDRMLRGICLALALIVLWIACVHLPLALVDWLEGEFNTVLMVMGVFLLVASIFWAIVYSRHALTYPTESAINMVESHHPEIKAFFEAERQWLADAPDAALSEEAAS